MILGMRKFFFKKKEFFFDMREATITLCNNSKTFTNIMMTDYSSSTFLSLTQRKLITSK